MLGEPDVMGLFARMLRTDERVLEVREGENEDGESGYAVRSAGEDLTTARESLHVEEVPGDFVQRLETPGGDVYAMPLVESLRSWLKERMDGKEEPEG